MRRGSRALSATSTGRWGRTSQQQHLVRVVVSLCGAVVEREGLLLLVVRQRGVLLLDALVALWQAAQVTGQRVERGIRLVERFVRRSVRRAAACVAVAASRHMCCACWIFVVDRRDESLHRNQCTLRRRYIKINVCDDVATSKSMFGLMT